MPLFGRLLRLGAEKQKGDEEHLLDRSNHLTDYETNKDVKAYEGSLQ